MQRAIAEAYRFCPGCGSDNPRPGQIPYKCSVCGFACFFGPVAAVGGLVVDQKGHLLLVQRATEPGKGKWGLPGGFIDPGENALQALHREIEEETGLQVSDVRYLISAPNQYDYRGVVAPVLDLFFVCRLATESIVRTLDGEIAHYHWATQSELAQFDMAFASNRLALDCWMSE